MADAVVVRAGLHVWRRCRSNLRVRIWWLSSTEPGPEKDLAKVKVGCGLVLDEVDVLLHADLRRPMQLKVELAQGEPDESVTCEDGLLPVIEVCGEVVLDKVDVLLHADLRRPMQLSM